MALLGTLPSNSLTLVSTRYWDHPFFLCPLLRLGFVTPDINTVSHVVRAGAPAAHTTGLIDTLSSCPLAHPLAVPRAPDIVWASITCFPWLCFPGRCRLLDPWPCSVPTIWMSPSYHPASGPPRAGEGLSPRPWWSWRSCRAVSSPCLSRLPRSRQRQRAVNPLLSTGEYLPPLLL